MLMEIYLSEEKAKKNNIDLNECYQKIDKYFKSRGVEIVSKGIYKGVKEDFDSFVSDIDYAQYGVLVPPMDGKKYSSMDPLKFSEECMANAIIEMLNNQKLREDYKERITNRGKDFSPDKITEQWLNVIKKL